MNKYTLHICIFLLGIALLSGCFEAPEYSNTPNISFRSLEFIDYLNSEQSVDLTDSLILRFDFQDGDGDIGLSDAFDDYPFHRFNIVVDANDSLVTFGDPLVTPPFYLLSPIGERTLFSETDNRPPFNECDYYFGDEYVDLLGDTIYKQDNEYYTNFHIDFYRKRNNSYSKVDFSSSFGGGGCDVVNFNGRIPIFDFSTQNKPLSGTINYSLFSRGFQIILARDTFKVDFYIYDRNLNRSNLVSSPDLTLSSITTEK